MQPCLKVQLLGVFSLHQGDEELPLLASADARKLLACLFLRRRPQRRSVLLGHLRPEAPEADARRALRQAIWHINRSLPALLETDARQVGLAAGYPLQIDVVEFEALIQPTLTGGGSWTTAAHDLSQAVALYQGDLLEGEYDDWGLVERERLRELYLQALEQLTLAFKATLRYEQALQTALQLARTDPLRESAQREVMRLYHYLGNPAAAVAQFERCRQLLQCELGLEPDEETQAVARAIARRDPSAAHQGETFLPEPRTALAGCGPGGHSLPLVGRSAEWAQLRQWLRPGETGQGGLILVEGEAGVGKTRLLREVAQEFEWHGGQLLWGKATQLETGRPLGLLIEALENGLTPLRREQLHCLVEPFWLEVARPLLPGLPADPPPAASSLPPLESSAAQTRLVEGLAHILRAWGKITPLLVILDDLHWADPDSVEVLLRLSAYLPGCGILLLATLRSEELLTQRRLRQKLDSLPWDALRGRLRLPNLEPAAARELARACLGGDITPCFFSRLLAETHGNPFFMLEILHGLHDEGVLRRNAEGLWLSPYDLDAGEADLPLPAAVEQVILRRLEQLPSELRALLESLSVLGGQFDFKLLAALDWVEREPLLTAVQEFLKRHLLLETPHGYQFRHDKIRQVVYENLDPAQRQELHHRLAHIVARDYPQRIEALAHHFSAGHAWPQAVHYQKLAAEKAVAAFAYGQAQQHLDQAIQAAAQMGLDSAGVFELLRRREMVLEILGEREAQGHDLEQMALLAKEEPVRLAQVRRRQACLFLNLSAFQEGESAARQAVALARQANDEALLIETLITLAEVISAAYVGQNSKAVAILLEAAALCRESKNVAQLAALHTCACRLNAPLPPNRTQVDEARQALALYQEIGDKAMQAELACKLGSLLQTAGAPYEEVLHIDQMALGIAQTIGYRWLEARLLNNLANLQATLDFNNALDNYDRAAAIFRATGDERCASVALLNAANYRLRLLGDVAATGSAIELALDYAQRAGDQWVQGYALLLAGMAASQSGDWTTAYGHLAEASTLFSATQTPWLHTLTYLSLAQVDQENGRLESALAHLARAEALAQANKWQEQLSLIHSRQAAVWLQAGDLARAGQLSAGAMAAWTVTMTFAWEIPFTRYRTLLALARPDEAAEALGQAHGALEKTLGQLTPEQRALSCRRMPLHQAILTGWQAAQPQQIRVHLPRRKEAADGACPEDGWVEVVWTVSLPGESVGRDKVSLRRHRLQRLLDEAAAQGGKPRRSDLAQALGVSVRTLAQDMAALGNETQHSSFECLGRLRA